MKENFWIELAGKRVGVILDRNKKQIWINRSASDFNHQATLSIGEEVFTINYQQPPANTRGSGYGCDPMDCC